MECFKVIGYYICELCDSPEWLQGIGRQILSVSGRIGEQTRSKERESRWNGFHAGSEYLCKQHILSIFTGDEKKWPEQHSPHGRNVS